MRIRDAGSEQDFTAVAGLMREFIQWHYERHRDQQAIIESYFDPEEFEAELAALPGEFSPPGGALLVAEEGGRIGGCVALRELDGGACEMKRMFVTPEWHGKGAGMSLAISIIQRARQLGFSRMMLDTGPDQREAQGLYRKLGFRDVAPYYELSSELRDWLRFMALDLTDWHPPQS